MIYVPVYCQTERPKVSWCSMTKETKAKVQRIKMRMRGNPVKLDGSITQMDSDGTSFLVVFDGPLPDTRFWSYGGVGPLVADKELDENGVTRKDTKFWEVL